jgi:hypothetical protein
MANAWDEPGTVDAQPPTYPPRRFGQLQNRSVPDTFDDPITDAEIAAWERPGAQDEKDWLSVIRAGAAPLPAAERSTPLNTVSRRDTSLRHL